jgi:predicted phosphohydrolase
MNAIETLLKIVCQYRLFEPIPMSAGHVWALSDFHLPSKSGRTMDRYGEIWVDHPSKIFASVTELCRPNDLLLVSGDISWATKLAETEPDFIWLATLPCTVLLSEGNHDRWAQKPKEVVRSLPANSVWTEKSCFRRGNVAVVSCRLWDFDGIFPWPGHLPIEEGNNEKLQKRELIRLENALKLLPQGDAIIRILMVHFPPLAFDASPGVLTDLINRFNVNYCVYGHVHGQNERIPAVDAIVGKTRFVLTSADWLAMRPIHVCEFELPEEES